MRRLALFAAAGAVGLVVAAGAASAPKPPPGKTLCVGKGPKCFQTLKAALAAAHDGDTIQLGPGDYTGGVTIDASVSLAGAGAGKTTIAGGGPVVTIGDFLGSAEPTVSISGVTITGGQTASSEQADLFFGVADGWAIGGGIYIPPAENFAPGATVTITDSSISGNTAAPTASFFPPGGPGGNPGWPVCPGDVLCPFAGASGGGIASDGNLTLVHTTVSGNRAVGPTASDAEGGGIYVGFAGGSLTLQDSEVSGNLAGVSDPNGRFAEGGGIFSDFGATVGVSDSTITGNTASLTSQIPDPYPIQDGNDNTNANSGGIHVGDGGSVTIQNSHIDGNTVAVSAPNGEPAAFDGGMCVCGDSALDLEGGSVSGNQVTASVFDTTVSGPDGSALEFDGDATVAGTQVTNNRFTVSSPNGLAAALGAISAFDGNGPALLSDMVIANNTMSAMSKHGSASIQGGGISNNGFLDLTDVQISHNRGTAHGHGTDGFAQGGGIWNGSLFGSDAQQLTLEGSTVDHNALDASRGTPAQGGGIYSCGFPFTLDQQSHVTDNRPDQIFSCLGPAAALAPAAVPSRAARSSPVYGFGR